jgi:hypothetical protein
VTTLQSQHIASLALLARLPRFTIVEHLAIDVLAYRSPVLVTIVA